MALGTIRAELAVLGRGSDPEAVFLRGALAELRDQVERAKSLNELRRLDASFCRLYERADAGADGHRRCCQGCPRRAAGRRRAARAVTPDRAAYLAELARVGALESPGPVLARLGLVDEWPLTGETVVRRWRGVAPGTRGAAVFADDGWGEPAVQAVLTQALAAAPAPSTPGPSPALMAGASVRS